MISLRRRLRLWAMASLVMQTAWVFVLIPGSCCAVHDKASATPPCHEETPATDCPLKATDGAVCPMHGGHPAEQRERCTMHNGCSGPMAGLMALLSATGVLSDAFELIADHHVTASPPPLVEQLAARYTPPDPPPPRA